MVVSTTHTCFRRTSGGVLFSFSTPHSPIPTRKKQCVVGYVVCCWFRLCVCVGGVLLCWAVGLIVCVRVSTVNQSHMARNDPSAIPVSCSCAFSADVNKRAFLVAQIMSPLTPSFTLTVHNLVIHFCGADFN